MAGWIPISSKSLPQPPKGVKNKDYFATGVEVLVCDSKGNVYIAHYSWNNTRYGVGEFWVVNSVHGEKLDIVAWKPKPEPISNSNNRMTVEDLLKTLSDANKSLNNLNR